MLRKSFTLPIEPFSINAKNSRDMRYTTAAYRNWEARVFVMLWQPGPQAAFKALREAFKPEEHSFVVHLTAYYPNFYTKQGNLSSHTVDCTNHEKLIVDLLFGTRYFVLPTPYGCPNLNCDDKHIISLVSKKKPGLTQALRISIGIVDKLKPC